MSNDKIYTDSSQPTQSREMVVNSSFELAVSMGKVPGYSLMDKFGRNPLITTSTDPEDIWEGGGLYNWSTTSDIDTLSSSSTGDTTQLIKITGIYSENAANGNGDDVGWAMLNGQNKVLIYEEEALVTPVTFWRVDILENEADAGGDLAGILYCYVDTAISVGVPTDATKIRAIINNGNNQTLMAIYTTRPKTVSFLYKGELGVNLSGGPFTNTNYHNGCYQSRRQGKVFKIKKFVSNITTGNNNYSDVRSFPDLIPAMTDIKLCSYEVTEDMGVWGAFDLMIIEESKFSENFLKAIGQPGYV